MTVDVVESIIERIANALRWYAVGHTLAYLSVTAEREDGQDLTLFFPSDFPRQPEPVEAENGEATP